MVAAFSEDSAKQPATVDRDSYADSVCPVRVFLPHLKKTPNPRSAPRCAVT